MEGGSRGGAHVQSAGGEPARLRPTAPRAHIVLAEFDRLYLPSETEVFLAGSEKETVVVRRVPRGHGWPVTHPELLETEVLEAVRATRAA